MKANFIKLESGLKFMIISRHELDGDKYLYLDSVTEKIKYIFAKVIDEETIEPVEDADIIAKLNIEAVNNLEKRLEELKEEC